MMKSQISLSPELGGEDICVKGLYLRPKASIWSRVVGNLLLYRPLGMIGRLLFCVLLKKNDLVEVRLKSKTMLSFEHLRRVAGGEGKTIELVSFDQLKRVSYAHRNSELQGMAGMAALGLGSTLGVYWAGVGIWASPTSYYLVSLGCGVFVFAFASEMILRKWLSFGSRLSFVLQDGTEYSLSPQEPERAEQLLFLLGTA
jgi:hypothetical protein